MICFTFVTQNFKVIYCRSDGGLMYYDEVSLVWMGYGQWQQRPIQIYIVVHCVGLSVKLPSLV